MGNSTPSKPVFLSFSRMGKCSAVTCVVHSSRFMPVFMVARSCVGDGQCPSGASGIVGQQQRLGKHLFARTATNHENPTREGRRQRVAICLPFHPRRSMDQIIAKSIFSEGTGYAKRAGFDYSCNPYTGCSYGCSYCYSMFLPSNRRPKEDWGKWFQAKVNAVELARREAPKMAGKAIYISTVTDPYMPVEGSLCLTRGILAALLPYQPRVLIQTRGPLVLRDIDVLSAFRAVRVNMSIPTDSEAVRQAFEPKAPPLERRWRAIAETRAAGIAVGICVTPMLPLEDPEAYVDKLAAFRPEVLVVQDFHDSGGG